MKRRDPDMLPPGTPLVNSHRMAKGDLTGQIEGQRILHAEVKDDTLLGWLLEKGFLEIHHKAYAMTLLDLRLAYDAGNGITWTRVDGGSGTLSAGQAAEFYHAICRVIGRNSVRVIEWCATEKCKPLDADVAAIIRAEHDRLGKAMDEEWGKRKETT